MMMMMIILYDDHHDVIVDIDDTMTTCLAIAIPITEY